MWVIEISPVNPSQCVPCSGGLEPVKGVRMLKTKQIALGLHSQKL